ncbi:MAG: ATP-dependent sacrificial sulfur transferase LarE [Candidatus Omnitrophota bacterium]
MKRDKKLLKLEKILLKMEKVAVAYSGGVDSTFLLSAAQSILGKENVLAVTALSESYPREERQRAVQIARDLNARQVFITSEELSNKKFTSNPLNRCYYCKKELFAKVNKIARDEGFHAVLDGSTKDDLKDMRYGRIAAREENVRSPIQEANMSKDDVRRLSKARNLKTWDKPSFACLASRFSYNQEITREKLGAIEKAEVYIKRLGFTQLRVRLHEKNIIRIEVGKKEINKFLKETIRSKITKKLKALGFTYITLDLMGYRTGSMNEGLEKSQRFVF